MSEFNEFLKKINSIMENNIIRMYYLFNEYKINYYDRFNTFRDRFGDRIGGYHDESYEEYEERRHQAIIRNTEEWFENDFLVYLNDYLIDPMETPIITIQDMKYYGDLISLMSLNPVDIDNVNLLDEAYFIYYINKMTFEDFKTLLYDNGIYNEVFMEDDDADLIVELK